MKGDVTDNFQSLLLGGGQVSLSLDEQSLVNCN